MIEHITEWIDSEPSLKKGLLFATISWLDEHGAKHYETYNYKTGEYTDEIVIE